MSSSKTQVSFTARHRTMVLCLLAVLLALTLLPIQAQEDLSPDTAPLPTESVTVPTETPAEVVTLVPTVSPTDAITPLPTEDVTPLPTDAITPVPTSEILPLPTQDVIPLPTSEVTPAPVEVALPLAFLATFDASTPAELSASTGWTRVALAAGQAMQAGTGAVPVTYLPATFTDAAVEAKFLLNTGAGGLRLRGYEATLSADGTLSLSYNGQVLATQTVPLTAGAWVGLRVEMRGTALQVRVNDALVMDTVESNGAGAGMAGFAASAESVLRLDDFAIYGIPTQTLSVMPVVTPQDAPKSLPTAVNDAPLPSAPLPQGPISCPAAGQIAMASVNGAEQGNAVNVGGINRTLDTLSLRLSYDGRYVFFISHSNNLVPSSGDTNGSPDLFRFDRTDCSTIRVNVNEDESQMSIGPSFFNVSDDGNLAVFSGFSGGIFVRDISAGATITLTPTGGFAPAISGDGQHIAFLTTSSLVAGDMNSSTDVYRLSLTAPTTYTLVSVSDSEVNEPSSPSLALINRPPAISDDGSIIVWASTGFYGFTLNDNTCDNNFDSVFAEKCINLFQRNLNAGTTQLVTVTDAGATGTRGIPLFYYWYSVSGNGRYVAFNTESPLETADTDTVMDVYRRDTQLNETLLVSVNHLRQNTSAPAFVYDHAMNDFGSRIAFSGANYTSTTTPAPGQVYVRNLVISQSVLASVNAGGTMGSGSVDPTPPVGSLSGNGLEFVFLSSYSNFVSDDNINVCDIDGGAVTNDQNCYDVFVAPVPAILPLTPLTTAPTVTASTTQPFQITLTLSGLATDTMYSIERNDGSFTEIASTTNNSFVDDNGTALYGCGTIKTYRVRLFRPADNAFSPYSAEVTGRTAPCAAPVALLTPAAGALTNNTQPLLDWADAPGTGVTYVVQVATDASFTNVIRNAAVIASQYTVAAPALTDGTYFWRVSWYTDTIGSQYSAARSFTIDTVADNTPVNGLTPVNISRLSTPRPVFTWQAVTGTPFLVVQVDDDGDFSGGLLHTSLPLAGTLTTYTPPVSLPQGIHFWRVVRRDAAGNNGNPVGPYMQFSLFFATTPATNGVVTTGRPAFSWVAAGTLPAPIYTLQVDNNPDFSSPEVNQGGITATTFTIPTASPLLTDGTRFWRVLVNGVSAIDDLSQRFIVSTAPLVTTAPVLSAPPAAVNTLKPTLQWAIMPNAAGYELEISTSSTFATIPVYTAEMGSTNVVHDASMWDINNSQLAGEGIYHARVRAFNTAGAYGPYSAVRTFTVDTTPPAAPEPQSPEGPVSTLRPTFTWTPVAGATYIVQIDDDGTFDSGVNLSDGDVFNTSTPIAGAAYTSTFTLSQNQYYFWRVVSVDAAGNRAPSYANPLHALLGNMPAEIVTNGLPSFTWAAVPGVAGYNVQIDEAADFSSPTTLNASLLPATAVSYVKPLPALTPGVYFWRILPVGGTYGSVETPPAFILMPNLKLVITAPALNTFTSDSTPTITWTDSNPTVPGLEPVRQYRMIVRRGTMAGPIVLSITTNRASAADPLSLDLPAPLTLDGVYVVTVAALYQPTQLGTTLIGLASDPRVFTVDTVLPAAPALTSPNGTAVITPRPTFIWQAVPGAVAYELDVSTNEVFSSLVTGYEARRVTATTFTGTAIGATLVDALPVGNLFFWRVRAVDAAGNISASSTTAISAVTSAPLVGPAITTLAGAAAGSPVTNDTTPALTLTTTNPAVLSSTSRELRIEFSTSATFATITSEQRLFSGDLELENADWSGDLAETPAQLYYVRARSAYVLASGTFFGPYSAVRTFTLDTTAPGAFTLTAPADSAVTPIRPTITWGAASGAAQYRVVFTPISFSGTDRTFTVNAPATTFTIPLSNSLTQGTWQVTVRALDAAGNETQSDSRFIIPFAGVTPANNAAAVAVRPTFTWSAITGATGYTLEIDDEATFTAPRTISITGGTVTTRTIAPAETALAANTRYYWRVIPTGVTDAVNRSFTFVTTLAAPAAPVLSILNTSGVAVAGNITTWSTGPTLRVAALPTPPAGTTPRYRFQFASNAAFTGATNVDITTNTLVDADYATLPAGTNFIRAQTCYVTGGVEVCSPFSAARTLIGVSEPIIGLPSPTSVPSNNRPTLTWVKGLHAVRYQVEVAQDVDFLSIVHTSASTLTTPPYTIPVSATPLPQGLLHWRVIGFDALGTPGRSLSGALLSSALTVRIGLTPAGDNAFGTITGAQPTFTWMPTAGAANYTLQIDTENTFAAPLTYSFTGNVLSHTLPVANALVGDSLYYWRVFPNTQSAASGSASYAVFFVNSTIAAPTLLTPSVNQVTLSPAFDWLDLPNTPNLTVQSYQLDVSTTAAFPNGTTRTAFVSLSEATEADLTGVPLTDGTYFWRVRGLYSTPGASGVFGPWSAVRSFSRKRVAPVIAAPATNATLTTLRPTFTWAAVPTAASYRVDIATDAAFSSLVVTNATATTISFTPSVRLPQTTLYARVRAVDAAGNTSVNSAARPFRLFIGTAPANGFITGDTTPTFTWAAQAGVSSYKVQFDLDGNFSSVDYEFTTSSPFFTPTTALDYGAYQWRVIDAADSSTTGLTRTLIISMAGAALPAPTLNAPANALITSDNTPLLVWSEWALSGLTHATELQIASAATFAPATLLVNETNANALTGFVPPAPLTDGVRYWRVRTRYMVDATGQVLFTAYTAPRSFTIDTVNPGAFTLTAPIDNSIVTTRTPTFSWTAASGAARYRLEVSANSDLSSPLYTVIVTVPTVTHTLPGFAGLVNGDYYWRVTALDGAQNSRLSVVRRFRVTAP